MIDAYRIGVTIAMATSGMSTLSGLMAAMHSLDRAVVGTTANLEKMKTVAIGAMGVLAGAAALKGMWAMVKAAGDLNRELERTKQLGGDFAGSVGMSRSNAFAVSREVPTIAPSAIVRLTRELGTVLGHPEEAASIVGIAAQTAHVVSNYTGEHEEDIIKNLIKVADLRAKIFTIGADGKEHMDKTKLLAELQAAAKGLILGGNYLKSGDILTMARQGGVPIKGMTPEAFYAGMIEMAISQGAARTGTEVTSLYQQMIGGTLTKKTAEAMTDAGLLGKGDWRTVRGGAVVVDPKAIKRFGEMEADPVQWLSGAGHDAVRRYATMHDTTEIGAIFRIFGRQTTQRLAAEAIAAGPQFERAREIFRVIPDILAQYEELKANNLATNIQGLSAAWKGFMEALGEAGIPTVIGILHSLTDAIHVLTKAAAEHPKAAEYLLELSAALAAFVALGGGITILTAALGPFIGMMRFMIGLAGGGGAVAAGGGASAAGSVSGGLAMGGAALGYGLTGALLGIGGLVYLGNRAYGQGAEDIRNAYLNEHRRSAGAWGATPMDGFGTDGRPLKVIVVNGRDIADGVTERMDRNLNRPFGLSGADIRASPYAGAP